MMQTRPILQEMNGQLLDDKGKLSRAIGTVLMLAKPHLLKGAKLDVRRALEDLAPFTDTETLDALIAAMMRSVDDAVPPSNLVQARDKLLAAVRGFVPDVATVELTMDRVEDRDVPELKIVVRGNGNVNESNLRFLLTFEDADCHDEPVNVVTNDGTVPGRCFTLKFHNIYKQDPTEAWYGDTEVFGVTDPSIGIRRVREQVDVTMN